MLKRQTTVMEPPPAKPVGGFFAYQWHVRVFCNSRARHVPAPINLERTTHAHAALSSMSSLQLYGLLSLLTLIPFLIPLALPFRFPLPR